MHRTILITLLPILLLSGRQRFSSGNAVLQHAYMRAAGSFADTVSPDKQGLRLYLTFDDGIFPESRLLDSISRLDSVPFTVFLVGRNVNADSISKSIFKLYQENPLLSVGNHSYSHANNKYRKYYKKPGSVVSDIITNHHLLGIREKIIRLPGRNVWNLGGRLKYDLADAVPAADSLSKLGYKIFGWDCEWQYDSLNSRFFTASQMELLVKNCRNHFAPNQVVILCHDPMLLDDHFITELRLFIARMRLLGSRFDGLEQYTPQTKSD